MANHLHTGDLPDGLEFGASVAVDEPLARVVARSDR